MAMQKISNLGMKAIAVTGMAIVLFLSFFSVIYTIRKPTWGYWQMIEKDSPGKNLLFFLGALVLACIAGKGAALIGKKVLGVIAVVLTVMIVGVLFYLIPQVATTQVADWEQVRVGTMWLKNGEYDEISSYYYFWKFPYQLELAQIFAIVLRLFRQDSYSFLQYVNAVLVGLTFYGGYLVAGELTGDLRVEGVYFVSAICFLPMYVYTFFVYGETIGVCFSVWAVYFFLRGMRDDTKRFRFVWWILLGIAVGIILIARVALIIIWIAMAIIALLTCMQKRRLSPVVWVGLCLGIALAEKTLFDIPITAKTGIAFQNEGQPVIPILAMGMQGDAEDGNVPGTYNGYNDEVWSESGNDRAIAAEVGKTYIRERLAEFVARPSELIYFYKWKIFHQWLEPTYAAFAFTNTMNEPADWVIEAWYDEAHERLHSFCNRYQTTCYIMLSVGFIALFRRGKEPKDFLLGLILIGGFFFSVIWEAQSRYVYPYIVLALPAMSWGLAFCAQKTEEYAKKVFGYVKKRIHT